MIGYALIHYLTIFKTLFISLNKRFSFYQILKLVIYALIQNRIGLMKALEREFPNINNFKIYKSKLFIQVPSELIAFLAIIKI